MLVGALLLALSLKLGGKYVFSSPPYRLHSPLLRQSPRLSTRAFQSVCVRHVPGARLSHSLVGIPILGVESLSRLGSLHCQSIHRPPSSPIPSAMVAHCHSQFGMAYLFAKRAVHRHRLVACARRRIDNHLVPDWNDCGVCVEWLVSRGRITLSHAKRRARLCRRMGKLALCFDHDGLEWIWNLPGTIS